MIPDVSQALSWLEKHPQALQGIQRGLERETLRVNADGSLATTGHPEALGATLTHKWITTDFAEALLEFITPVDGDIDHMLTLLRDVHRYTARQLGDERMWPLSMPCYIAPGQDIELAQYGTSNIGRLKTLYREGLKNRYGALMQTISGVHYNFSLPMAFWEAKCGSHDKEAISAGYFRLIRNYYRFGWVIPYLFGASPAICSSFLQGKPTSLPFEKTECGMYYLPYATSLRLSDLGYTNKSQSNLGITFNELHEYVAGLKRAIKTPSEEYEKIGLEKDGKRLQINSNVLQIERHILGSDGQSKSLDSLRSGELVLVWLEVKASQDVPDALVVDLLPAGLELENQNLANGSASLQDSGSEVQNLLNQMQQADIQHVEFRDDRFVAAVAVNSGQPVTLVYLARAVTPGTYQVPMPMVESMYVPQWRATGVAGDILIVKP